MDQAPAARRRSGLRIVALGLGLLAVAAIVVAVVLRKLPASRLLPAGTPLVRLKVVLVDDDGHVLPASASRLGEDAAEATPAATATPVPVAVETPGAWFRPSPTPTEAAERDARLKLTRAPIALSVYALRGAELLDWMERNATAREILSSPLVRGIFIDALRTLRVRGEDLKIPDVNGPFVEAMLRDVVSSGAALHYDLARGRRGYVLAFDRGRSAIAGRVLPIALRTLARREYLVAKASLSVVEAVVGEQSLFVAESGGTVYVGSSLAAVLNTIEMGPLPPPKEEGTIAVTLRAEAWLDKLLPLATGAKQWSATWSIDLAKPSPSAGIVRTSGGTMFGYLSPAIADGVLAAVPRDVFAAAVASVPFPKTMTPDDWNRLAHEGLKPASGAAPAPSGIGIVWDLSAKNPALSDVGLIVKRPEGGEDPPLDGYVRSKLFRETCGGETVWLVATSELLANRMRESCDRQSVSLLARRAPDGGGRKPPQLLVMVNPASGLRELLESGIASATHAREGSATGGAPTDPEWKQEYLAAVERARTEASGTLRELPTILFEGTASERGATLEGTADWPKRETAWRTR